MGGSASREREREGAVRERAVRKRAERERAVRDRAVLWGRCARGNEHIAYQSYPIITKPPYPIHISPSPLLLIWYPGHFPPSCTLMHAHHLTCSRPGVVMTGTIPKRERPCGPAMRKPISVAGLHPCPCNLRSPRSPPSPSSSVSPICFWAKVTETSYVRNSTTLRTG